MLATITPQAAAESALKDFCHDIAVEGGSNGSFSIEDLVDAILHRTGPARVTLVPYAKSSYEDTILIGNRDWQVVLKVAPTEANNPRFFGFECGNYPLRYLLQAGGAWWLDSTAEKAA
jgi:hypothetical protein